MLNLTEVLAQELGLRRSQVQSALDLFAEGATVPFIARYRKERTGGLDETQLREIGDRHAYLSALETRKAAILKSITEQGKLTDELAQAIATCTHKTDLEDLYLPYRPKRRTRAAIAREKGLEPLADQIRLANTPKAQSLDLSRVAAQFVNGELGVADPEAALAGAADILAEQIAEQADLRNQIREAIARHGQIEARIKPDHPEGSTDYETYRQFQAPIAKIAPHQLLAILRGEREGILKMAVVCDRDRLIADLEQREIRTRDQSLRTFWQGVVRDAFLRLLEPSLGNAVLAAAREQAEVRSVQTFADNLRDLLLAAPAGAKPTLGVDPGFRTGCKLAALDATGRFLATETIYPHGSTKQRDMATATLRRMIQAHGIELIAIGNGTASRETDQFVGEVLAAHDWGDRPPIKVTVSEAGASVYSASPVAIAEFPDLDVTARGAISIGRRLQDPLAELVKIDPRSIGVGQYQHDLDAKLLTQKLGETVESCVNFVGVDLNTASAQLLGYVAGITPAIANNIVTWRNEAGAFRNRRQLLKVAKLGPKAFEQSAGFLRIRHGDNPLDNTAVHPESYDIVATIAQDLALPLERLSQATDRLRSLPLQRYVTEAIGEPTLRDILQELEKPGRDPRAQFTYAHFDANIQTIADLKPGLVLEGVITNVANFGAFVDLGIHQNGLVHISQLADRFVSDPRAIVRVGQVVKVRVLSIDEKRNRIALSMRQA